MTIGLYAKAVAGSVVTGLTTAVTALEDGTITPTEWTVIAAATLGSLGAVWMVPNVPAGVRKYAKAATAALFAAVGAAGTALAGDGTITPDEWLAIVIALLGGAGITYTVPNAEWSDGLAPTLAPAGAAPRRAVDSDHDGHPDTYEGS